MTLRLYFLRHGKAMSRADWRDDDDLRPLTAAGEALVRAEGRAMKAMGLAKLGPYYERALRYSMGLPVSTTIVGMESMDQLKKNLAVAENFTPLGDEEKLEFHKEIIHLATPEVMRWKTKDYFNPVVWEKR